MGLFRTVFDAFSTWKISDKFGAGAGLLYADYAQKKSNGRDLEEMKSSSDDNRTY